MSQVGRDTLVDGRYRVAGRLGQGGMADVWEALDTQLDRRVAVKLLHAHYAVDQEFRERFRREASAAAGLQHPNIVAVFDRGAWDGTPYIAMELVDGRTLKDLVREAGPLPPGQAIDLAEQVLRALGYAHRRGIVHRDIKPQNVLVNAEGDAKVADFGIAQAGASDMTETGSIVGTAQYLSPEQAQGHVVSPRSDLYAVGVVLYELLTGRVPFDGDTTVTVALRHVSEHPVPPSQLNPAIPPALENVVLRALQKDPARRFASAEEFVDALELARGASAVRAPIVMEPTPGEPWDVVSGRRRTPLWVWAVALLAVAALLAGGAYLLLADRTAVPDVVGQRSAAAQATLARAGFKTRVVAVVLASVPRGEVSAQDPRGDARARKGTVITLTVSSGPGTVAVPEVEGLKRAQATERLEAAGFKVQTERTSSDSVPTGTVIRSAPGQGTVAQRGAGVTLTVSSGRPVVTVPDVRGQGKTAARQALEAAGLTVGAITREETTDADPGTVIAQAPAGDARVRSGTAVAITVARRPPREAVPNVVGRLPEEARSILEDAGFEVRTRDVPITDPAQAGRVTAQTPPAGEERTEGATVTLDVGAAATPPTPTPTPTPPPPG